MGWRAENIGVNIWDGELRANKFVSNDLETGITITSKLYVDDVYKKTTTNIKFNDDVDMDTNYFYLSYVDDVYFNYDYLFGFTNLNSSLEVAGYVLATNGFQGGLTATTNNVTTTTGMFKANNLIIDGGYPAIPNVIGVDTNGSVSSSLFIGGIDEGGADSFYNLSNLYLYGRSTIIGDATDITNNTLTINSTTTINKDLIMAGYVQPFSSTDASAPNNSVYYSSTQSKLVYKDSGGTANPLY